MKRLCHKNDTASFFLEGLIMPSEKIDLGLDLSEV